MAGIINRTSYDYELPQHLLDAIDGDLMILTHEQLRELIEIEAGALGLTFEEADELARAGKLPKDAFGTSVDSLLWMYRANER